MRVRVRVHVHVHVHALAQFHVGINHGQVRVVSMPSWELFARQPVEYRRSVFVPGVPVVSVEALSTTGWERYSHLSIGMRTFGASAPDKVCLCCVV